MLKILSAAQLQQADSDTIQQEAISSTDLMERAAHKCFEWICDNFTQSTSFICLCGSGNNGGDGLAISRMLLQAGYTANAVIVGNQTKLSKDCSINKERLLTLKPESLIEFNEANFQNAISPSCILIDALFGTGLTRPLDDNYRKVVQCMNQSGVPIVSIDVPSGLLMDSPLPADAYCVQATYTLSFQCPKLSFLLPSSGKFVGQLVLLDIGLAATSIDSAASTAYFLQQKDVKALLKSRALFSHKGSFGHALLVAGSNDKMGAAQLCIHACLRAGTGLVSALVPQQGRAIIQTTLPEAMLHGTEDHINTLTDFSLYSAIGIGPGLGKNESQVQGIKILIQQFKGRMVFDADALNILADNKTWLGFLHSEVILTPHVKEFERLTEKASDDFHRLQLAKEFAIRYKLHLLLKGKYSVLCCPDGTLYFNSTGNPGMAKGGSGDVLTGILTGLMAQGYTTKEAGIIGMYLHGKAGDIAAKKHTEFAMKAGDIIDCMGDAFAEMLVNS
ncbi:MAG TPA: NAD(P)H-hydrate dehydratase [Bacteroidia bacterium]|nr:NAD(P)H-hydrate dehydratase [Bacteroidia bacterium]HRH08585.1 NAD(P)H-hydrate dehydratase [Bacteroidia bacterium]HRH64089.1 NAD(P)H-hydrate dehydratase [Bacteroidia bacterium]